MFVIKKKALTFPPCVYLPHRGAHGYLQYGSGEHILNFINQYFFLNVKVF